jgi:hypothetical protein
VFLLEQRTLKFSVKLEKNTIYIFKMCLEVYGEGTVSSRTQVFVTKCGEWFQDVREDVIGDKTSTSKEYPALNPLKKE